MSWLEAEFNQISRRTLYGNSSVDEDLIYCIQTDKSLERLFNTEVTQENYVHLYNNLIYNLSVKCSFEDIDIKDILLNYINSEYLEEYMKTKQTFLGFTLEEVDEEFDSIVVTEQVAYDMLKDCNTLYCDIETTGLNPLDSKIVTIQILGDNGKVVILKDPETLDILCPLLEEKLCVFHNAKFDTKFIKHHFGISMCNLYDSWLSEIAISGGKFAGRKGASLKDLVYRYCGVTLDKTEQCGFMYGVPLTKNQETYATNDLKYLPKIVAAQKLAIQNEGLENIIDIEMKAIPAVVWLELSGMPVNTAKVETIRKKLVERKNKAQSELYQKFGTSKINLNSPLQLVKNLNRLHIPVEDVSEEGMAKYSEKFPIMKVLKEYKETEKLLNTFVDKIPEYMDKKTERVHSSFNSYGARSGRFTSSKPNLQQQPSKFVEWRTIYCAKPGNKIITADYSQIELRILGQIAGEQTFIDAYKANLDLHSLTASKVFKMPLEFYDKPRSDIADKQRKVAKTINFGIAYGLWIDGLVRKLKVEHVEVSPEEAERYIKDYYKTYPQIARYLRQVSERGLLTLEVRSMGGRLMKFEVPTNEQESGNIKRESKNLPIQSLCADMVKIALRGVYDRLECLGHVKFINCVHDEIVLEAPESQAEYVAKVLKAEMEKAGSIFLTDLPCISEVLISDYWEK